MVEAILLPAIAGAFWYAITFATILAVGSVVVASDDPPPKSVGPFVFASFAISGALMVSWMVVEDAYPFAVALAASHALLMLTFHAISRSLRREVGLTGNRSPVLYRDASLVWTGVAIFLAFFTGEAPQ